MKVLKDQVEQKLMFDISEEQYQQSIERAKKKLLFIISMFGDCDGIRRKPEYLIELISEDIIMNIFSKVTIIAAQNMINMEKEHSADCQSTLTSYPYSNMNQ